mmetsp:Transcript_20904/g.67244  ORF Transcript_20904/g.67244 Transcript_20904/m.67244 type:complete len:237 (+) Transcript_20904:703-1413(+)
MLNRPSCLSSRMGTMTGTSGGRKLRSTGRSTATLKKKWLCTSLQYGEMATASALKARRRRCETWLAALDDGSSAKRWVELNTTPQCSPCAVNALRTEYTAVRSGRPGRPWPRAWAHCQSQLLPASQPRLHRSAASCSGICGGINFLRSASGTSSIATSSTLESIMRPDARYSCSIAAKSGSRTADSRPVFKSHGTRCSSSPGKSCRIGRAGQKKPCSQGLMGIPERKCAGPSCSGG